jgi:hypothetical protein
MTNSHFFKPPNHTLKKPLQNGFWFVTKWFVLVPIKDHAFKIKMIKPAKTHKLLQNGKLDPILRNHFPQNGSVYRGPNPSHSVEEMAWRIRQIDIDRYRYR